MTSALQRADDERADGTGSSGSHAVQFYESDSYLTATVASFLAAGLAEGRPAIVVATEQHRREIGSELRKRGFDLAYLQREHQLVMADARGTLERFMVGGAPDDAHFRDTIEPLLRQSTLRSGGRRPNVFG